jgi:hypothetical protein
VVPDISDSSGCTDGAIVNGGGQMLDQHIKCIDCGKTFVFDEVEQEKFKAKGWDPPKRCHACRLKKRERKNARDSGRVHKTSSVRTRR